MAEKEVSTADLVTIAGEVVTTANVEVSTASPTAATITNVELTLAQTLAELKSARPKTKGVVIQEPSESTPTISLQLPSHVKVQGSKDKAKVEADYQLAQRLQAQEQEELSDAEKATSFVQLLEKRRKHFKAKKRRIDTNKAQQRSFSPQESSSKRAGEALEQESSKKQKVDDDKETKELKQCMEIISDGVTIEATPLSTKSPTIVDYKIYKEGKKSVGSMIIHTNLNNDV
ncbi:hypothetical protein Tco_0021618 [Tanacetum coccineum]